MKKTYEAPTIHAAGDVVRATEVSGMPPQAETLFRQLAPGSVGFML